MCIYCRCVQIPPGRTNTVGAYNTVLAYNYCRCVGRLPVRISTPGAALNSVPGSHLRSKAWGTLLSLICCIPPELPVLYSSYVSAVADLLARLFLLQQRYKEAGLLTGLGDPVPPSMWLSRIPIKRR